ncbi:MAG: transporter substrate-binding domain-containing protein [Coriobacteriia bacterium]|nr:transporter substrate-binding domain-containing protein [Coriobacteriia bacterium]
MRFKQGLILLVIIAAIAVSGCAKQAEEPAIEPTVAPPVIGEAGVLRAGVDLSYPPFAGEDGGVEAGLDVDIVAAIAERLGLKLELVDIGPGGAAAALEAGDVDIALGALPITDAVLADVAFAGSYLVDGPAFFSFETSASADSSATAPVVDAAALGGQRVGAQQGSVAFWSLEGEYGEGFVTGFTSLADALEALAAGEIDVVAGDAAIAAYLARDYPGVVYAGQYGSGLPLGVAIAKDATELETAVRETLDALAAEGVLDTIKAKWLGTFPQLGVASEAD